METLCPPGFRLENMSTASTISVDTELGQPHGRLPGLRSRLTQTPSRVQRSDLEDRFLRLLTGQAAPQHDTEAESVLLHFQYSSHDRWHPLFDSVLHPEFLRDKDSYTKFIAFSCAIMEAYQPLDSVSVVQLINSLQESKILRSGSKDSQVAQQMVFNMIGWTSMLFTPSVINFTRDMDDFHIVAHSNTTFPELVISSKKADRPVKEMLRDLGSLFPSAYSDTDQSGHNRRTSLPQTTAQVSYLNVATMKRMAGMKIRWVESIGEHLKLDQTIPAVCIYKFPSFCVLQGNANSFLSQLLENFHEEDEVPCDNFSIPSFMSEILLSYQLLFQGDGRARKAYRSCERANACIGSKGRRVEVDALLDQYCDKRLATAYFSRNSYDLDGMFPILKQRLLRLQGYMEGISPDSVLALFLDRRDVRLWYGIWAALILGLITIIQQTIAIILTGEQVALGLEANKLARLQLSQG